MVAWLVISMVELEALMISVKIKVKLHQTQYSTKHAIYRKVVSKKKMQCFVKIKREFRAAKRNESQTNGIVVIHGIYCIYVCVNTYNPETGEMLVDNRVCLRRMAFI